MLTISDIMTMLGLVLSAFGLGYAIVRNDKTQK